MEDIQHHDGSKGTNQDRELISLRSAATTLETSIKGLEAGGGDPKTIAHEKGSLKEINARITELTKVAAKK